MVPKRSMSCCERGNQGFTHDSVSVPEEEGTGTTLETEKEELQGMVKRETQRVVADGLQVSLSERGADPVEV